ncbi:short-chain dehydrogenase [Sphaerisporangium melleum]|uniref:Short-chain dehydrogenase n=1 Tax=Sphaerisporangium melleum TaxID=321316 RepID=A0A917RRR5_9ACTN|nr:short-chain dehydrogenase/reductase [Sphaerisporangium melleum]GGL22038.1 short-chain dehydrogenase [Sphaerisporangium melleum]GII75012.1 short-chain dehydrogenase [Sphaerisporangium melleum]
MDLNLRGKRALVTGASKGIGAATAEVLAEEGCHVHLAARDASALEDLVGRLRAAYGIEAHAHPVDLRRAEDLADLASGVPDLDILVNNAGDIPGGALDAVDRESWRHAWELKVFGYIDLTRLVYARMKAQGHGVIVNNIGMAGERVDSGYIAGSSGNAALMAFTRALGGRSLRDGVRVVGVNPGPVATDRIRALLDGAARSGADPMAAFPAGRAAAPREVADLIAFLASARSSYTSGVVVTIDGGLSATA